MKDFTNQLLQLTDGLNINKFHLVGFSLGSLIARDFASSYSNRLSSLIIFGTVFGLTILYTLVIAQLNCVMKKLTGNFKKEKRLRRSEN